MRLSALWLRARRAYLRLRTILYARCKGVQIGHGVVIWPGARLSRSAGGAIVLGDRTQIHPGAMLLTYGGDIRLGKRCSVNPYAVLYGHGGLSIGDCVRIAAHCVIIPANHSTELGTPIVDQPITRQGVVIGRDVWLGAQSCVLDGARIGAGCVLAAGAVARGVLAGDTIYAGVPARPIRPRRPASGAGPALTVVT